METPIVCIDIGNSTIKAALFSLEGKMQPYPLQKPTDLTTLIGRQIAYVDTRLDTEWRAALEAVGAVELSTASGLPFRTLYTMQLGPDRAAQLVAVWSEGSFPSVVISAGTACTIDYMDREGIHRGGMITAGIHLRLRALAQHTGRLPHTFPVKSPPLLGCHTVQALQAGVIGGFQREVLSTLTALQSTYGPFQIWLTGGEAPFLQDALPASTIFAPELTLRGVWLWLQYLSGGSSLFTPSAVTE